MFLDPLNFLYWDNLRINNIKFDRTTIYNFEVLLLVKTALILIIKQVLKFYQIGRDRKVTIQDHTKNLKNKKYNNDLAFYNRNT